MLDNASQDEQDPSFVYFGGNSGSQAIAGDPHDGLIVRLVRIDGLVGAKVRDTDFVRWLLDVVGVAANSAFACWGIVAGM